MGGDIEGDFADMCSRQFPLMLVKGRAEGLAGACLVARTLIGMSIILFICVVPWDGYITRYVFSMQGIIHDLGNRGEFVPVRRHYCNSIIHAKILASGYLK